MSEDLRHRSHGSEIAGRCPACKGASLFVGVGGHVTCSRLECPAPFAADDALRENGYAIVRSAVLDEVRGRAERAEAEIVTLTDYGLSWRERAETAEQEAKRLGNELERLRLIASVNHGLHRSAHEEADQALAAIACVRALHPSAEEAHAAQQALCIECCTPAPCPTRKALDDSQSPTVEPETPAGEETETRE
ncbi:hypothetical protein ETD86_34755 [Nonomuraea turkmeniaca]|uniref:Uncharacterized protein n=1 Tax=Nonomuraea turkmeniaca TaxID=103838 RepID=A0A5S4F6G3_9ACTN|nr:hypothetical protein [Nonomuraea turkmeniaca]TMR11732.1 hypothetical protein ETD86_34755 [Nonomuraea turkmeniaca]